MSGLGRRAAPEPRRGGGAGAGHGLRAFAAAVVGLSFLWPCLGSFVTMRFRHVVHDSAFAVDADWHVVILSTLYLAAVAACLVGRRRVARALASPRASGAVLGAGAVGLVGHALLVASPRLGAATTPLVLVGFACSVAFIVGHILAWASVLPGRDPVRALLAFAASNALSYGLCALIDLVPGDAMLYYLLVCPAGSAAGLVASGMLPARHAVPSPSARPPAGASAEDMGLGRALRGLPWRLMAPTIVLFYFEQAFSAMLFLRHGDWSRDYLTLTLAICCAVWAVAAAMAARRGRPDAPAADADAPAGAGASSRAGVPGVPGALLELFVGLVVVYMAALLVTVVFNEVALVPERVLVAAGSCLRNYLWCLVALAACARRTTPVAGACAGVFFALAVPVSRLVSLAASQAGDPALLETLTSARVVVPAAVTIIFLVAVALVVAQAREAGRLIGEAQAAAAQARAASEEAAAARETARAAEAGRRPYADLAGRAGLSAREAEVFELLCQGYSAKRIGERLGISESTVVSHTTHVYRKFNVSSKQELLALVDAGQGGER